MDRKKLIILGDSAFAEIAYEYFTHDSDYSVVGFSVEQPYLSKTRLFDLPVIAFEDLETQFDPSNHFFHAAIAYGQKNKLRHRLYTEAKQKGYSPASYVSSHAFVWRNCKLGEHVFIFENNVVQPFASIESNVVLWSGNHIGHHSSIGAHCFISSHVVVSGFVQIGDFCFFGVNSTVANNVKIGRNCLIGAGALVLRDVEDDTNVVGMWRGHERRATPVAREA